MSLVESRSHIIHVILTDKMTAKNDLQTEYVYTGISVGVIEALVVILSACYSLKLQKLATNHGIEIIKRSVNVGIGGGTFWSGSEGLNCNSKGNVFERGYFGRQ